MDDSVSYRRWQLVIRSLTLLVVPAISGVTFHDFVARWPVLSLLILIVYEIGIFMLQTATKVWKPIENWLVEKTTKAVIERLEGRSPRYRRKYLHNAFYRHRTFDVKGLGTQGIYNLQMEQVFVDLSIVPQSINKASANMVATRMEPLPGRRYKIHDLLTMAGSEHPGFAVIGPPGSGKTTLLKHVTLTVARNKWRWLFGSLPVLVFLREHADSIRKNANIDLAQVIEESLASTCPAPKHWFRRRLDKGRCIMMMDGLDEIPDPAVRKKIAAWLDSQITKFIHNRFIITSRPFGYKSNPLANVSVFEVRPFSPKQVREFVHNWYKANETMAAGNQADPGVVMAAVRGADDLLARLQKSQDLAELAINPLLLTMISTVHRFRSSLPGRRVELYSEMCDVFLGNRQRAKGVEGLDLMPGQKRRVLEPLAYELMLRKKREISRKDALTLIRSPLAAVSRTINPEEFLRDVEDLSGVLIERENSVYSFAHLTFQEYLAAAHIRSCRFETEVLKHIGEPWWHEVLRLYSAQGDASPVILACLLDSSPSIEILTLAAQCMNDAFEVKPELRDRLERVLATASDDQARRLLAQQMLTLRVRRLLRSEDRWLLDDSMITCAEYQLFLDNGLENGLDLTPDHWDASGYFIENAAKPVTGVRASDAEEFCSWLTNQEQKTCKFRLPNRAEADASPLRLVAQRVPLFYWVTDLAAEQEKQSNERKPALEQNISLVSATEFEVHFRVDIVGTLRADLALIVRDDLQLAGAIERTWENWKVGRLHDELSHRTAQLVRWGPAIHIHEIADVSCLPLATTGREVEFGFLVGEITLLAASSALSRKRESEVLTRAVENLFSNLSSEDNSKERTLILELMSRIIARGETVPRSNLRDLITAAAGSTQYLAGIGAPLQGSSYREIVAAALAMVCPIGLRLRDQRIFSWTRNGKSENKDSSLRLRALLRILSLVTAWIILSPEQLTLTPLPAERAERKIEMARRLIQLFVDLSFFDERLNETAPAVEGIRLARQIDTDHLRTLFEEHNN